MERPNYFDEIAGIATIEPEWNPMSAVEAIQDIEYAVLALKKALEKGACFGVIVELELAVEAVPTFTSQLQIPQIREFKKLE
jgi:hypothetical protein